MVGRVHDGTFVQQPVCVDSWEEAGRRFLFYDYPHPVSDGDVHGWTRCQQTRYMVDYAIAIGNNALSPQLSNYRQYLSPPTNCVYSPGLPASSQRTWHSPYSLVNDHPHPPSIRPST